MGGGSEASVAELGEAVSKLRVPAESRKPKKIAGRCDMQLGDVTQHNVQQLRRLNEAVFPVSYNDKFYKEVVSAGELAKLLYFNDLVVGAVCCRYDTYADRRALYIMTLGALAPYRRLGVGTKLLDHVLALAAKDQSVECCFLHVQVSNDAALAFYERHGFKKEGTARQYYKRIEPDDAFILVKKLGTTASH